MLTGTPYASYAYSYPHKMAYLPFSSLRSLADAWTTESKDALFLYVHIPFCEMRCGFCNLFTTANPAQSVESQYLAALKREAERVRISVGPANIVRMAVGGGTPTYLSVDDLNQLFDIAENVFEADLAAIPISVETSPRTGEREKLRTLRDRGVTRVSIGVQSFVDTEVTGWGAPRATFW